MPSPLDQLESRLLDHVRGQVEQRGASLKDEHRIRTLIRKVLDPGEVKPEEQLLLQGSGLADLPQEEAGLRIAESRIQRALGSALELASLIAGLPGRLPRPRVRIQRPGVTPPVDLQADRPLLLLEADLVRAVVVGDATLSTEPAPLDGGPAPGALTTALGQLGSPPPPPPPPPGAPPPPQRGRPRAARDPMIGQVFDGKYRILRRVGKGGFGAVYEAKDMRLDHRVAIKVLHPQAAGNPEDLADFKNEARRLTHLDHPAIVDWKVFDRTADGTWYFVMELLKGEELGRIMKQEGKLELGRTARLLLQVLDALRAAHNLPDGESLLHLDLKPSNVFLLESAEEGRDRVKVIDFGIGQFVNHETEATLRSQTSGGGMVAAVVDAPEGATISSDDAESIREKNRKAGNKIIRSTACTPEYAAPEHCAHLMPGDDVRPLDGRADVYSLAVIGVQALTGSLPYDEELDRRELMRAKQTDPVPRSVFKRIKNRRLAAFLERCLAIDPDARYADTNEAYRALHRIVHPPLARRMAAASLTLSLAAAGIVWKVRPDPPPPRVDLYHLSAGSEVAVTERPIYLGPARPSVELRFAEPEASAAGISGLRILDGPSPDARPIEGLAAAWQGEDRFLLEANGPAGRRHQSAYVEIAREGLEALFSEPLTVLWLGPEALRIDSVSAPGDGSPLDPVGNQLEIRLEGKPADVESVLVRSGSRVLNAQRDSSRSATDAGLHLLALERLELPPGRAELDVEVRDRAGGVQGSRLAIDVVPEPLAISSLELQSALFDGVYFVSPPDDPLLRFELNRPADVTWRVRDPAGGVLLGGALSESSAAEVPLAELPTLLQGGSFSGRIELSADEGDRVVHAPGSPRGRAERFVEFVYSPNLPALSLLVGSGETSPFRELDPSKAIFLPSQELVVHAVRGNEVPIQVRLTVASTDGAPLYRERRAIVDPSVPIQAFEVSVPGDGRYEVRAEAWRQGASGLSAGREGSQPDASVDGFIVVDTQPPSLEVSASRSPLVWTRADEPGEILIHVRDPVPEGAPPTPVDLRWELVGPTGRAVGRGPIASAASPERPAPLSLPAPWPEAPTARAEEFDGEYRLIVRGTDGAGGEAVPDELPIAVSLAGPTLELLRPAAAVSWSAEGSGMFALEVLARDPNGVRAVRARALSPFDNPAEKTGSGSPALEVPLEVDTANPGMSIWKGSVAIPVTWSEQEIRIELGGTDALGSESVHAESRRVATIELHLPEAVGCRRGGTRLTVMRLVRGNAVAPYVFGGRVDPEEQQLFQSADLGPYNTLSTARSWRIAFEAGEIGDFYLDEDEVSTAEVLAFLSSPDGYADPSLWNGVPPGPERREELMRSLEAASADAPAAGLSWDEAAAFAAWAGKRLPSLVEWEYALRGGDRYRPYSSYGGSAPGVEEVGINHDPELLGTRAPWPRGEGRDLTPDTRIRSLSGNLSEWTATPATFLESGARPTSLAEHARANRPYLLDPWSFPAFDSAERFWVAGGSYAHRRADFSVADRRLRRHSSPQIGFRCALTAQAVLDALGEAPQAREHGTTLTPLHE